tara:strand:- start:98 stop:370 length:273 start_codon:yes stop_codon:yes gene_type:complete
MSKKQKTRTPAQTTPDQVNKEAKEAVAEALEKARAGSFGKRIYNIFIRTIFILSLTLFSFLFGILALVLMPIVLPIAFLFSSIKGDKIKL